jgi:hypothetical protein
MNEPNLRYSRRLVELASSPVGAINIWHGGSITFTLRRTGSHHLTGLFKLRPGLWLHGRITFA